MSVSLFMLCFAVGAAALALWVEVRFPSLSPIEGRRVFLHVLAAVAAIYLLVPTLGGAVRESGLPAAQPLTALGIALPAVTYLFLTSLWILKLAQQMMPGAR